MSFFGVFTGWHVTSFTSAAYNLSCLGPISSVPDFWSADPDPDWESGSRQTQIVPPPPKKGEKRRNFMFEEPERLL